MILSATLSKPGKNVEETTLNPESVNLPTSKAIAAYINTVIGEVIQIRYVVVEYLPQVGEVGVIYLIPHQHGDNDLYDEYIYADGTFEKIGNTDVDLSNYARVDHTHRYSDLLNLPNIQVADNETIKVQDNKLTGSRIKVLNSDPLTSQAGDMWILKYS